MVTPSRAAELDARGGVAARPLADPFERGDVADELVLRGSEVATAGLGAGRCDPELLRRSRALAQTAAARWAAAGTPRESSMS